MVKLIFIMSSIRFGIWIYVQYTHMNKYGYISQPCLTPLDNEKLSDQATALLNG